MKIKRILAAALALLTVASVSGCAISAALEEEGGFKFTSTQVSAETQLSDPVLRDTPASELFDYPAPSIYSIYTEKPYGIVEGDIYVSVNGSDETGDGSKEKPYQTIVKARDVIRGMKAEGKLPAGGLTVSIMAGEYRISEAIEFTEEDSGTKECPIRYAAYGDGEVIFRGSTKLNASDFVAVGDDIKAILPDVSDDHVVMIDLKKYGITSDDIAYQDPDSGKPNVIVSIDRKTYTLARYPNGDESVKANGHNSDKTAFMFSKTTLNRVKEWSTTDGVWISGLFWTDYEVDHGPAIINLEEGSFVVEGVEMNRNEAHMFFSNILDELDVPGEYYIDRENCILYVYPEVDLADAEIEFVHSDMQYAIRATNVSNYTIQGFTFIGFKNCALSMDPADNSTVYRCKFYCVGRKAADVCGDYNSIIECEAHYLGGTGLTMYAGEKETLRSGYNLMENCYATHWSLENITEGAGLGIGGYGNTMRHCEMAYSTGNAINAGFANNIIEYNLVHDCTTWATDMASLYVGSSVACVNQQYRYNIFYNVGYPGRAECAFMFWDDGHCSQRSYGNLFVNVAGYAQTVGGGHNHTYMYNTIVNTGKSAIYYDQRPFDGYHIHGGAEHDDGFYSLSTKGYMWSLYQRTPYMTQVWLEAAPHLSQALQDASDTKAAHFLYSPAFSLFVNNVIVSAKEPNIFEAPRNYSTFRDNYINGMSKIYDVFVDPDNGDYRIREDSVIYDYVANFKQTPYQFVGRY